MRTVLQSPRPVGHDLGQRAMTLAATFAQAARFMAMRRRCTGSGRGAKAVGEAVWMAGIHIRPGSCRQTSWWYPGQLGTALGRRARGASPGLCVSDSLSEFPSTRADEARA